jgi:hypothetical protein
MSFFDRFFVGSVIEDLGVLAEQKTGFVKTTVTVLLAERDGQRNLVFRSGGRSLFGGGVSYVPIPASAIPELRKMLDAAEAALGQRPSGGEA